MFGLKKKLACFEKPIPEGFLSDNLVVKVVLSNNKEPKWVSKFETSTEAIAYFILLFGQPVATETKLFLSAFIYLDTEINGEQKDRVC